MQKISILFFVVIVFVCSFFSTTHAQEKPIQISLVTPVQIFPENYGIVGLRLNLIYGRQAYVQGIDWGLINVTTGGTSKGIQVGLVGLNDGNFVGLQYNFVNITHGSFKGLQWGFVNNAGTMSGLQLGFINIADNMLSGLQIGLINIIHKGGAFPFFPIINWSF